MAKQSEAEPRRRRSSTGIRFADDLHERLTEAAEERGLTLNWFVNRLCEEGMERLVPANELRLTRPVVSRDPVVVVGFDEDKARADLQRSLDRLAAGPDDEDDGGRSDEP